VNIVLPPALNLITVPLIKNPGLPGRFEPLGGKFNFQDHPQKIRISGKFLTLVRLFFFLFPE